MAEQDDPLVIDWRPVPPQCVKRGKTQCEDELLDRLGVCRKEFAVHPFILRQPFQRARTQHVIEYSSNTGLEKNVNPLRSNVQHSSVASITDRKQTSHSEASRQLLKESRRGPRNLFFSPNKQTVPNTTVEEVEDLYITQKQRARSEQDNRLEKVFNTWRGNPGPFLIHDRTLQ